MTVKAEARKKDGVWIIDVRSDSQGDSLGLSIRLAVDVLELRHGMARTSAQELVSRAMDRHTRQTTAAWASENDLNHEWGAA